MINARVSTIEDWRWFRDNSEEFGLDWQWFVGKDRSESDRMAAGTALHKYLEQAAGGHHTGFRPDGDSEGYVFDFECDVELILPNLKEHRTEKQYGDMLVTGQCDGLGSNRLVDFKFTCDTIDMEKYLDSYQWRFYLDMFGVREFQYMVFRAYETKDPKFYRIVDVQKMSVFAYPDMRRDCLNLATEFYDVAQRQPFLRELCQAGVTAIK